MAIRTKNYRNFRAVRTVTMVTVAEGDGTPESPFKAEMYILDGSQVLGVVQSIKEEYEN